MKRFDEDEIREQLANLGNDWEIRDGKLSKTFEVDDFAASLKLAHKIGEKAEEMNHHPDLTVSWGKLGFSVMSHDTGGLTDRDLKLARLADAEYEKRGA